MGNGVFLNGMTMRPPIRKNFVRLGNEEDTYYVQKFCKRHWRTRRTHRFYGMWGTLTRVGQVPPEELLQINKALDRWRQGYETEDVNSYINTFWEDGFLYVSDMGTDGDKTDDLEFDDIRQERDAATRVFERFQDIEIELSVPPEISMNEDGTQAEVRNHYRIQLFISDGHSLEGGFSGVYAEGDNLFIFEKRNDEWRIVEWHDEAFSNEEIRIANNL